ncbi:MAG TPA: TonB-dependent receptor [Candidatus Acidoferrum sp.]|nr:TonB-dependent receptor [Candidatus Acidoferrum sp.]
MTSRGSVKRFAVLFSIALLFFFSPSLSAQITSEKGAIRIAVADPQGASVGAAKVSISSKTGVALTKTSAADGSVVFPLLDPGNYEVTVESPNFRRAVLHDVAVHVTEVTTLNVALELGEVSAEVVVSADAVQAVNTSNATLGNVLTQNVLQDLPLSTRNFTFLLALNAGTSQTLPDATQAGRGEAVINVAGQRGTANNLVINGTDSNELLSNNFSIVPVPSPDSLEEFRVQTSLYDASQGKTSGGNVDVLTRGGTSAYHGEAYEFFRNDDLNSNLYFFNATGTPRPELKQNQFGGNFGGPIPAVVSPLKNTFFFLSYEGTRQINGVAGAAQADFPVLPAQRTAANIESAFGLNSIDPTALALLNAPGKFGGFLIPSGTGVPGTFGEATFSEPLIYNEDQFNLNIDRLIGTKNKISERFFFSNSNTLNPLGGEDAQAANNNSFGSGNVEPVTNRLATIAWTSTISPNLINEARLGYNRITFSNMASPTASLASVGMTRFNSATNPDIPVLATFDINPEFGGASTNFDQQDIDNTFNAADTLAWTHGKHTVRVGVEYRRYQINLFNNFAENGFLLFDSFNDFLQGNLQNGETFVGTGITNRDFRGNDIGAYAQDDWKITKRLTLNLGIRYDYLGPLTDTQDRLGNFDPTRLDIPTRENAGEGLLNGFILPAGASFGAIQGTSGVTPSTLLSNSPHNFAPRIGLAWDPKGDGKTSVRAGYGIYYIRTSGQTLLQLITSEPFFQLSALQFGPGNPGVSLANPFPNLPTANQFPIFSTPPTFTGINTATDSAPTFSSGLLALNPFDRNLVTPYVGNWNLTIQRELPMHFFIEVGYIGSEGVHLLDSLQRNQALLANAANPITVGGQNGVPQSIITTNSVNNVEARAGVLGFDAGGGLNEVTDLGHSSYNAFIFTVNHRTGNLFLQASYTFSKTMDNESGGGDQDLGAADANQLDIRNQRAVSDFNVPQRIVATYEYKIPGFKSGALGRALGGWSIGGLTTFQSGLPSSITCPTCAATLFGVLAGNTYPNLAGSLNNLVLSGRPENFTGTSIFNSSVLAATQSLAPGSTVSGLNIFGGPGNQSFTIGQSGGALFGDLGRNIYRGPFEQDWDLYLSKKIPITEKYSLTFRSEFFNVFNHPNFANPNTEFGTPAFGQFFSTVGNPRIIQLALKFDF